MTQDLKDRLEGVRPRWLGALLASSAVLPSDTLAVWNGENYVVAATPETLIWIHVSWDQTRQPVEVRREAIPRSTIKHVKTELALSATSEGYAVERCTVEIEFRGKLGDEEGRMALPFPGIDTPPLPEASLANLVALAVVLSGRSTPIGPEEAPDISLI